MSAASALPTRDADSTFGPNIEAELSKVVDVPDALPRSPCVQHFTDDRCATCRRSNEVACGTLQLRVLLRSGGGFFRTFVTLIFVITKIPRSKKG